MHVLQFARKMKLQELIEKKIEETYIDRAIPAMDLPVNVLTFIDKLQHNLFQFVQVAGR
jgi:hypothetical protein